MDPASSLIVFCIVMFAGAFASGYIPLSVSISESRLRLVTIFGAGLLVGTALVVIIPEGVAMHYEAQTRHAALHPAKQHSPLPPGVVTVPSTTASEAAPAHADASTAHVHDEDITHEHPGHWQIGAALALGFAFQLLVDRVSGELHSHSHVVQTSSAPGAPGDSPVERNPRANPAGGVGDSSAKSKSAMAGMVVHAAVDGVALGAAVREGDGALGFIVFLAIILHKFPSSFGLSSYLLHHGVSHDGVKRRLLLFSSAAPISALVTYTFLSANLFVYQQEMLALCLLFSGGTFLYVSTAHVLPEIQAGGHGHDEDEEHGSGAGHGGGGHSHGGGQGGSGRTAPKMKWGEVAILIAGIMLPLAAPVHHGH